MGSRFACALLTLGLAGCNGHVTLSVTDAAVDSADSVTIEFTGVEFERADGRIERFEFDPPKSIDLLDLEGGVREKLVDDGLPTEDYRSIRLRISADGSGDDSFIVLDDGTTHALELAAADAGGLKVSRSFSLSGQDDVAFTIDFDLRRSIRAPTVTGEPYRLVPELRLVEDDAVGTLAGTVAASRVPADCVPAVYVYTGSDVEPADLGGSPEPLNTGRVLAVTGGGFSYKVGALPDGRYTAALTCTADEDEPDQPDSTVTFEVQENVSVEAGQTTTQDF